MDAARSANIESMVRLEKRPDQSVLLASDEEADELRNACGDYLQIVGFDETYEPTEIGKYLERLIDKLYVP